MACGCVFHHQGGGEISQKPINRIGMRRTWGQEKKSIIGDVGIEPAAAGSRMVVAGFRCHKRERQVTSPFRRARGKQQRRKTGPVRMQKTIMMGEQLWAKIMEPLMLGFPLLHITDEAQANNGRLLKELGTGKLKGKAGYFYGKRGNIAQAGMHERNRKEQLKVEMRTPVKTDVMHGGGVRGEIQTEVSIKDGVNRDQVAQTWKRRARAGQQFPTEFLPTESIGKRKKSEGVGGEQGVENGTSARRKKHEGDGLLKLRDEEDDLFNGSGLAGFVSQLR